jgi:hypothetical protein
MSKNHNANKKINVIIKNNSIYKYILIIYFIIEMVKIIYVNVW